MEDQQRLNSLLNEINTYRQQAELIQQQIEMIQASIAEVDALFATLDDIEGKESIEAFVPVGAGSFIKGELKSTDEIIVSIGSGIAVKKDAEGNDINSWYYETWKKVKMPASYPKDLVR